MAAQEKAIHFCIGLLEGLAVGELKDNAKTIELGIKAIRELEEHCDAMEEGKTSPQWSREDVTMTIDLLSYCRFSIKVHDGNNDMVELWERRKNWIQSIRDRFGKKFKED